MGQTTANYLALSTSFQDSSALGPVRAFHLVGTADCVVTIEAASSTSMTPPGLTLPDPNSPPLVNAGGGSPTSPQPLVLRGPSMRTPAFLEASIALRYVLKEGTSVTAIWVDAAPQATTGPAGNPGPNWLSNNTWAHVTGTGYTAIAGEMVLVNTAANTTVTLPTAVGVAGQRIRVQDATGGAETHNITIATTSSQTINGASALPIQVSNGGATFVSDGANWYLEAAQPAEAATGVWISNNAWAHVTGTSYVAIADELVLVNTGGATTVTLPTAVGCAGRRIRVQDATGTANTHNITIATTSSQTIQGTTPVAISTANGGQTYVSDGANWFYG